jgi:hypothetical protein
MVLHAGKHCSGITVTLSSIRRDVGLRAKRVCNGYREVARALVGDLIQHELQDITLQYPDVQFSARLGRIARR